MHRGRERDRGFALWEAHLLDDTWHHRAVNLLHHPIKLRSLESCAMTWCGDAEIFNGSFTLLDYVRLKCQARSLRQIRHSRARLLEKELESSSGHMPFIAFFLYPFFTFVLREKLRDREAKTRYPDFRISGLKFI